MEIKEESRLKFGFSDGSQVIKFDETRRMERISESTVFG